MKLRRVRSLAALLVGLLVAVGCDSSGSETEGSPSTDASSATVATSAEPSGSGLGEWQVVRDWSRGDPKSAYGIANSAYALLRNLDVSPNTVRVEDLGSGDVLWEHDVPSQAWSNQSGWLSDGIAVVLDTSAGARVARLSAYDIQRGEVLALPGGGRGVGPEADVSDGRLAYTEGSLSDGICVHVHDLQTGRETFRSCSEPNEVAGDLALVGDLLSYTLLVDWDSKQRCKRVVFVDLASGRTLPDPAEAATERSGCLIWSGMPVTPTTFAWDEADPTVDTFAQAQGYAWDAGVAVPLGAMDTDSMVTCAGRLFWQRSANRSSIMTWRPGGDVEVVLAPEKHEVTTTMQCSDGRWLATRLNDISGKDEHLRQLSLDVTLLD